MLVLKFNKSILKDYKSYLSENEIRFFNKLKTSDRKAEWLAGRMAVKKLIKEIPKYKSRTYQSIELVPDKLGKPKFEKLHLSISHIKNLVVAEVDEKSPVGVDIEKVRKFKKFVEDAFLTNKEKSFIATLPKNKQLVFKTVFWSLKESYLKMLGQGLRKNPLDIEITEVNGTYRLSDKGMDKKCILWYNIYSEDIIITKIKKQI
jgi:4'-phosphopantetheinyl transferase